MTTKQSSGSSKKVLPPTRDDAIRTAGILQSVIATTPDPALWADRAWYALHLHQRLAQRLTNNDPKIKLPEWAKKEN